jgi:hypothetical protein
MSGMQDASTTKDSKPGTVGSAIAEGTEKRKFGKKPFNNANNARYNKFEGRCEELKGHIYDYGKSKNTDQFVQTTKKIKNYVGRNYKNSGDITIAISKLKKPTLEEPNEPDDPDDKIQFKKWESEYDAYCKNTKINEENVKTLYNLVWGQCTDAMQQKIASLATFEAMEKESDDIALLIAIKDTSYHYQSQKYRIESIHDALYRLMTFKQGQYMTTQKYYEQFTNLLAVYIHCGGSKEPDPGCLAYVAELHGWDVDGITDEQKAMVRELSWANLPITHADRNRYVTFITGLQNDYLTGNNKYPATLNEAYSRLTHWKDPNATNQTTTTNTYGVSFTNVGSHNSRGTTTNSNVFITTVADNKSKVSNRDYLHAIEANKLYCKIGRPSYKTFLRILDRNLIPNCPVTRRDALNAEFIFGKDIGSLKGKTVRQPSTSTQPILNDLPWDTMAQYRDVTLSGDIFYVNKIMFFLTRSRHIKFSRKPETVMNAFLNARNLYLRRGFTISHFMADGEFECLRGSLLPFRSP